MYTHSQTLTVALHRSALENDKTASFRNVMFKWRKSRTTPTK